MIEHCLRGTLIAGMAGHAWLTILSGWVGLWRPGLVFGSTALLLFVLLCRFAQPTWPLRARPTPAA